MKILMVCLGNICRSPLAEGVLRSKLPENFDIGSAGTIAMHEGNKADRRSIKVAKDHGIDIKSHRARIITKQDLQNYDRIYCMDLHNLRDLHSMAADEEQRQKISLLMEAAGETGDNNEVPDPYYGDFSDFEKVYQLLDKACNVIAEELTASK